MDNDIITIFPGNFIVDVIGTPLAPVMRPTPILPGLSFSTVSRGGQTVPPGIILPSTRGSVRVSVTQLTPPPGFVYLICGLFASAAPRGAIVVLVFADSSIVCLHSPDGVGLEWAVATAGAVPDGTNVTMTASWDAENPIDGIYHAKGSLEGYPLEVQVAFGGEVAYPAQAFDTVVVAEVDSPGSLTFPNTVGRVQYGTRVV